jgi:hypothetical protein
MQEEENKRKREEAALAAQAASSGTGSLLSAAAVAGGAKRYADSIVPGAIPSAGVVSKGVRPMSVVAASPAVKSVSGTSPSTAAVIIIQIVCA